MKTFNNLKRKEVIERIENQNSSDSILISNLNKVQNSKGNNIKNKIDKNYDSKRDASNGLSYSKLVNRIDTTHPRTFTK